MQRLRDVMTSPVLTLTTWFPASDAWAEMAAEGVRHAVVVDGTEIRGVVSTRDLGGPRGGEMRMGRAVGELMNRGVVVASPQMSVERAMQIVRARRIGCIPVVRRGKLVGIVTRADLLGALSSSSQRRLRRRPGHGAANIPHPPPAVDADTHPRR
jgi:CBS domain-containing membrane protein